MTDSGQTTGSASTKLSSAQVRKAARRRRRFIALGTVAAVVFLGGGGAVYALTTAEDGGNYRTADAATGTVDQELALSGSVEAVTQRDVSFSVAGTVKSVSVAIGDEVLAGQKLASLSTTDLAAAVTDAKSDVSDAKQTLADDLDAQASGTSSTTTASSSTSSNATTASVSSGTASSGLTVSLVSAVVSASATPTPTSTPTEAEESESGTGGESTVTVAVAAVEAAQDALLAQYDSVSEALAVVDQTIASSDAQCQPFLQAVLADDNLEEVKGQLSACQTAIAAVQQDQLAVDAAQQGLLTLVDDLNTAATELQEAVAADGGSDDTSSDDSSSATPDSMDSDSSGSDTPSGSATPSTDTDAATPSSGTDDSSSSSTGSTTETQTVSAEAIVSDRADLAVAEAALDTARYDLKLAKLTSPIAGTVAAVSIAKGDEVGASSTSAVITVVGEDGYLVSSTVTLANISTVEVGQLASVQLGSTSASVSGAVASVGVVNSSTDSTTPSYAVTIALDPVEEEPVLIGGSAQIEVAVASAADVLTVPASALHRSGSSYTVDVLADGQSVSTEVEVGTLGAERVEILSGLSAGDAVILADLDAEVTVDTEEESSGGLSDLGGSDQQDTGPPAGFGGQAPTGGGTR